MDFKAYGVECSFSDGKLILKPVSFLAKKAMGSDDIRIVMLSDIIFMEFVKGNIFVNTRIVVGEINGKTYIPVVPWGDNNFNAEVFYNALYDAVKPYGNLAGTKPAGLRNDSIQALRDEKGIINEDMQDNIKMLQQNSDNKPLDKNHGMIDNSSMNSALFVNNSVRVTDYEESMPPIVATEYAIIDLETTGLSPDKGDKIIEIGIMIVDAAYNIVSTHETLVNPKRPVTLTHVHGIDDRMIYSAPTIEEINDEVLALLHNRIVVAHNAMFEQRFLNSELSGRDLTSNNFLDTLKYARLITPTENHKLGTIAEFYNVPYVDAHTAMGDVIVTRQVLASMLPAHPNSQHIASEDLTPYFNPAFGESNPVFKGNNWVGR